MYYKPKHFSIEELVPKQVFLDRGEKAWELMDARILIIIDNLRDEYGAITINNWHWGGERQWSGLRTPDSPYYSKYSQHTTGRAVDIIFRDTTAEAVRQDIIIDSKGFRHDEAFAFITAIEDDVSWLHVDCRNIQPLFLFKP